MRVDGCSDGFNRHGIDHLRKSVLLPVELVIVLELEELAPLGVVLNFWIEDLGQFDAPELEFLYPGSKTHFGLGEHERKENVLASPFGGRKMARKCHDLVAEVSNGVEVGLSHNCVEWDCFHTSPDHFGDGGHCCRDRCHDCAILALTTIT